MHLKKLAAKIQRTILCFVELNITTLSELLSVCQKFQFLTFMSIHQNNIFFTTYINNILDLYYNNVSVMKYMKVVFNIVKNILFW